MMATKTPETAATAMVMPAIFPTSNGAALVAVSTPEAGLAVALSVMLDSVLSPLASFSEATLFTLSEIQRPAFR